VPIEEQVGFSIMPAFFQEKTTYLPVLFSEKGKSVEIDILNVLAGL
jgi:hypothetical protein